MVRKVLQKFSGRTVLLLSGHPSKARPEADCKTLGAFAKCLRLPWPAERESLQLHLWGMEAEGPLFPVHCSLAPGC
jgi:hypothetical protein